MTSSQPPPPLTGAQALSSNTVFVLMNFAEPASYHLNTEKAPIWELFPQTMFEEILQNADRGLDRRRSIRCERGAPQHHRPPAGLAGSITG